VTVLQETPLVLHFVGLDSLLGDFLTQMSVPVKRVVAAMLHGALAMLVSGLALDAVDENGLHKDLDSARIATKPAVLVAITGLIRVRRVKGGIAQGSRLRDPVSRISVLQRTDRPFGL
jgi:hypothetical protein